MIYLLVSIGVLLGFVVLQKKTLLKLLTIGAVVCSGLQVASAQQTNLYSQIVAITEESLLLEKAELVIERYIPKVLQIKRAELEDVYIDPAIAGDFTEACKGDRLDYSGCIEHANRIQNVAKKATFVRSLAKDLQLIATSYEAGIVGYTSHPDTISGKWPSITAIWQSGHDIATGPVAQTLIRAESLPDDTKSKMESLEGMLEGLIDEENGKKYHDKFASAVSTYRHGVTQFDSAGSCNNGKADEPIDGLEYLNARWCNIEDKLKEIRDSLPTDYEPPLRPNEIVIYQPVKFEELSVYAWVRNRDAGIASIYPLFPVQPTYIDSNGDEKEAPFAYAPAPEDPEKKEGICSHPFGKNGYLCREFRYEECPVRESDCPIDPDTGDCYDEDTYSGTGSVIQISSCEPQNYKGFIDSKFSGVDACQIGGWRLEEQDDDFGDDNSFFMDTDPGPNPDLEVDECSHCVVDVRCESQCPGAQGGATTKDRNADGIIEICINEEMTNKDGDPIPATYFYIHEMVHAQQLCDNKDVITAIGQPGKPDCCAIERMAYYTQCVAHEEDGDFEDTNMNADICAYIYANTSCSVPGDSFACNIPDVDDEEMEELENELHKALAKNAAGLPISCSDSVSNPDPRVVSQVASLPKVCSANCKSKYQNTIGNNLCYIGQCIEQSVEEHRISPGRWSENMQDQQYPWESCMQPDPQFGAVAPLPPRQITKLPPYRPQFLIEAMDHEFCKINGFPKLTPTVLCGFDVRRRLGLPLKYPAEMANNLGSLAREFEFEQSKLHSSTYNIGARFGTKILRLYLDKALLSFNEITLNATSLLRQIGNTQFPRYMCPRYYSGECQLFDPPGP